MDSLDYSLLAESLLFRFIQYGHYKLFFLLFSRDSDYFKAKWIFYYFEFCDLEDHY